ncbi:MAG: hypothetical protein LM522_14425, partial [Candidatus Contendobacter sp.]|nr:hypothetical protein [Candidatus Contendobacter sp.]
MTDQNDEQRPDPIPDITSDLSDVPAEQERREFLRSLGKWSQAVIGGVLVGGALTTSEPADAWYNRGGSWVNRHGGGGGSWVNRHGGGGWANRGGS